MPTVYSLPWFFQQFCDNNGDPLSGGKVETKYAGTSSNKATYSDSAGSSANANPVILDSSGMCRMFLRSGAYDFHVYDSDDNLIKTVSGVNALTVTTDVEDIAELRALQGGESTVVRTLGYSAINDGGRAEYYWSASSSAADDGGGAIQPDSLPAIGRWLLLIPQNREINVRLFGAVCDGVTDDTAKIQACDDWCTTNKCVMVIDSDTYFATDPQLVNTIKIMPGAELTWGSFNPEFYVRIDSNDLTQHFDWSASYYPKLYVNWLRPEWFGEVHTGDPGDTPKTLSAYGWITGGMSPSRKIYPVNHRFKEATYFDESVYMAKTLDVTGYSTLAGGYGS